MSVLETPRIYFGGEITWDPITTNNDKQFYDEVTDKATLPDVPPESPSGTRPEDVFRAKARAAITAGGNWNPHGTHRTNLVGATVVGVDLGAGVGVDDDIVGRVVTLSGKLVDAEPYGATSSQLFYDRFELGTDGGDRILMPSEHPMIARWINFRRNPSLSVAGVASVVWQASARSALLEVISRGSHALTTLHDTLADPSVAGLTVRFNAYRTLYNGIGTAQPVSDGELAAAITAGGFHPNPARGLVVGVIGLWRSDEAPSLPSERLLTGPTGWGAGFARVETDRLVLDLANSIPETDPTATKGEFGTLTVVARTDTQEVELGTLRPTDYERTAYEAMSGIVTLVLTTTQAEAARAGTLQVRSSTTPPELLLDEVPTAITADRPVVYLDQGDSATVSLRVRVRGVAPGAPVSLTISRPSAPASSLTTDADGVASLAVNGGAAGCETWEVAPSSDPSAAGTELIVRTLESPRTLTKLQPTWQNVYENVLRNWYAMAPCMDNWLRLDSEDACRRLASHIKELTSAEHFERSWYMPVTRDLSAAHRDLLHRWCDVVLGLAAEPAGFAAAETSPVPDEAAALSLNVEVEFDEPHPFGRGL
jgi:hypothetical protein